MARGAAGIAVASMALVGCPGLDALSRPPVDAGVDAPMGDAGADAPTGDAGLDAPGSDGPDDHGTAPDAIRIDDAGACIFVDAAFTDALSSDDPACVESDGSSCGPVPIAPFESYSVLGPPRAHAARCTPLQLQTYLTDCPIPPNASAGACAAFFDDPANAACVECVAPTSVGSGALGPVLSTTYGPYSNWGYNFPGCVALLEPCNATCAQALWAGPQCQVSACLPPCGFSDASASGACEQAAATCLCAAQVQLAGDCYAGIQANQSPGAQCFFAAGVLSAFCGM
jgi:hypothetical protein